MFGWDFLRIDVNNRSETEISVFDNSVLLVLMRNNTTLSLTFKLCECYVQNMCWIEQFTGFPEALLINVLFSSRTIL